MAEQNKQNQEQQNQPDKNMENQAAPDQEASHYDETGQGGQGAPSSGKEVCAGKNPVHDKGDEKSIAGREDS